MFQLEIGKVPENVNPLSQLAIKWCLEHSQLTCQAQRFSWQNEIVIEGIEACTVYTFEMKVVTIGRQYIFSKDSVNFFVYSWTPGNSFSLSFPSFSAVIAVDTQTLRHTIPNVRQLHITWTDPNPSLPKNCQQNTMLKYYREGHSNDMQKVTTETIQVTLDHLENYQTYFVQLTVDLSSKIRPNETSQNVSPNWIRVGPTAPGSLFLTVKS
ncbi:hypothetical protein Ciccas_011547 [Cichlidogyrus casuarinus]|uniref:Fibronectin type-III domain-containing protein n=1 Tax=Cichlidogyrus casuarinus TaxID=1844966 RepID=A0ABD2PS43_9PLAT